MLKCLLLLGNKNSHQSASEESKSQINIKTMSKKGKIITMNVLSRNHRKPNNQRFHVTGM